MKSSLMLHWNLFQLFQPIGGSGAMPDSRRQRKIVVGLRRGSAAPAAPARRRDKHNAE